jgi:hypothetical protein
MTSSTLRLQETLFDQMWEYSAAVIKELKVYRQQRSLEQAQYFAFYICNDLDEALALMDEEKILDEFGGIIWNKLYRREDLPEDHVMEVARSETLSYSSDLFQFQPRQISLSRI